MLLLNNNYNMKLLGPNSLAQYIYYLFRLISLGLLLFVLFIDLSFIIGNFEVVNDRYFMSIPPFGNQITGDYKFNVILTISIGLFFGAIFFYVLSNIFKALREKVIFNKKAVINLKIFTILNLLVGPILYFLVHFPIMKKTDFGDVHNLILHLIFGMIALFLFHIFKRALYVQSENDLTI